LDKYLIELIKRTNDDTWVSNSDESISFQACREAEALCTKEYIPQLIEFIKLHNKKNEKKQRNGAYFILGKLLIKIRDDESLQFLINQVQIETNKYIIGSILDRISDIKKPESIDIEPIIKSTNDEKWLIRHSAINALKKCEGRKAHDAILEILDRYQDMKKYKYEITYANSVLSDIGVKEDIIVLEKMLSVKIRDIRESAQYAINIIKNRDEF